jgi:hypothetical protein
MIQRFFQAIKLSALPANNVRIKRIGPDGAVPQRVLAHYHRRILCHETMQGLIGVGPGQGHFCRQRVTTGWATL